MMLAMGGGPPTVPAVVPAAPVVAAFVATPDPAGVPKPRLAIASAADPAIRAVVASTLAPSRLRMCCDEEGPLADDPTTCARLCIVLLPRHNPRPVHSCDDGW